MKGDTLASVQTHSEDFGRGSHLAVNVKYRGRYPTCPDGADKKLWDRAWEIAEETIREFWWEDAEEIARDHGYAGVFSEGRSDGWCVPYTSWSGQVCYPDLKGVYPGPAIDLGELARYHGFRRAIEASMPHSEYVQEETQHRYDELSEDRFQSVKLSTVGAL